MAVEFRAAAVSDLALFETELAIDQPAAVQQGDLMLLEVGYSDPDIDITPPAGWSTVASLTVNGGMKIYSKRAGASEPDSYVVEFSPFAVARLGIVAWYSTTGDVVVVDRAATLSTAPGSADRVAPSVTTRYDNGALNCFFAMETGDSGLMPDPAMTERYEATASIVLYLMTEHPLGDAGATGARTGTGTSTTVEILAATVAVAELQAVPSTGDVQILLDQYILTNQSHTAELSAGNQPYETTTINAGGTTYEMVRGDATLRHAGYFSGVGAGYLEQEMEARLGASTTVHTALLLGTSITDCIGYVLPNNANFELVVSAPAKDVITVDGLWSQGSGLKRGKRFFDGLIDDLSDQDGIDLGAAGSNGGWAYLFVHEVFGSVTICICFLQ